MNPKSVLTRRRRPSLSEASDQTVVPDEVGIKKSHNGYAPNHDARIESALRASELSYRRLFEAAKDGILILDVDTGRITDVNPFLVELLGFSHGEMVGKTVGELSPFKDIEPNKA